MKKENVYTLTTLYDGDFCDSIVYSSHEKAYKAMKEKFGDELWNTLTNVHGVTEDDLDSDSEDLTPMLESAEDHNIPHELTTDNAYVGRWEFLLCEAELQ